MGYRSMMTIIRVDNHAKVILDQTKGILESDV